MKLEGVQITSCFPSRSERNLLAGNIHGVAEFQFVKIRFPEICFVIFMSQLPYSESLMFLVRLRRIQLSATPLTFGSLCRVSTQCLSPHPWFVCQRALALLGLWACAFARN